MRRIIGLVASLVLVVTACGDDSGNALSDDEQAVADAVVEFILADEDFSTRPLSEDEGRCLAESTVQRIGVEGLAEIGITADSVPDDNPFEGASGDKVDAFLDAYFDCLDLAELFASELAADGTLSEDSVGCLADELSEGDLLREMLRSSIVGEEFDDDAELMRGFLEIMVACLSPEELVDLAG